MNRKNFLIIILLFAVGCTLTTQQQIISSQTPSIALSTATLTAMPTRTLTSIPLPTWTPLPTVALEDLQRVILDLVNTNKECDFPCWWGIKPGNTDWFIAKAFLNTLSPTYWQPDDGSFTTVTLPLPDDWNYASEVSVNFYESDSVVSSIRAFTYSSIAEILSKYGKPNEIWIEYHEDELQAPHYSFYISLGYFDKGFMVTYFRQVLHDDKNHICPYRDIEPEILTDGFGKVYTIVHQLSSLSVWNPLEKKTFEEIIKEHYPSWNNFYPFKPLEEITKLNVTQFADIYKDPATIACIKIEQ